MTDLNGKVCLVTGASRGIGRASALRLAGAGADVAVNYLTSQGAAREVAEEIRQMGRQAAVVKADVSEPDDVQAMVEFLGTRFGRLDVLVSNVASGGFRSLMDTTPQHLQAAMSTNVTPLLTLVQAARPLLERAEGRAKVVAMSSHGSHRALPAYGTIGTTKAALESLVRHLALELGGRINFNIVLAGLVETDSTRSAPPEAFERARAAMMVDGRPLTAADVADAVVFLASAASDLIQGQTLIVDGGASLRG
ncbi:MAG: SDR family oxidoreductase [Gemmatimonadota bacterium]|nr:SDR family oxidoreductase [Gemmatimonadota bacterium]